MPPLPTEEMQQVLEDAPVQPLFGPESSTTLRKLELAMVLFVAFSSSLVFSVLVVVGEKIPLDFSRPYLLSGITMEAGALSVLAYVLFRQGRSFKDIGLGFEWRDIPRSVGVFVASYVGYVVCYFFIYVGYLITHRPFALQKSGISIAVTLTSILFLCLNPFFEELIVRAYLISELSFLTGKGWIAVLASTLFQASYHLYQGYLPAAMYTGLFFVFSLYYWKTKRIGPVILAHLYMDLASLLLQPK